MALTTGFNVGQINGSISKISAAYENLIEALQGSTQIKFVNKMTTLWACKDAQDFFATFKSNIDGLIVTTNEVYQNIYDSVTSAGKAWAEVTGNAGSFMPNQINIQSRTLDVSGIQENINGVRGIDLAEATETVALLKTVVYEKIKTELANTKSAAEESGFIGANQQENLIATLGRLQNQMDKQFDQATTDAKQAIEATVKAYEDTGNKIASAFAGN